MKTDLQIPRTIMVPTDFSHSADRALAYARVLAEPFDARVVAVHVTELTGGLSPKTRIRPEGYTEDVSVEEYARATAERRIAEQVKRVLGDFPVVAKILLGPPAPTLAKAATELGAHLVVMGTHGRTGLAHLLIGSVAERVVRTCEVPVLTIRSDEREPLGPTTAAEQRIADEETG